MRRILVTIAAAAAMTGGVLVTSAGTASASPLCDALNVQLGVNNPNPPSLLCGPHGPVPPSPCSGSLLGLQVGTNPTDPYLICV